MFVTRFDSFLRDESGSYTVWSLIWFSLYVAMGGLAVDMTDAYRNQTLLQATADSSSLAGVISLPNENSAKDAAVAYSTDNMAYGVNGVVLNRNEVFAGNWDFDTRTFTDGAVPLNAVRAITRRANENGNPLAANFMRIMSLWGIPFDRFNISTQAIAVKYVPSCIQGGMVAGNRVSVSSNNGYYNDICIHGQNVKYDRAHQNNSVEMQNGNVAEPGVQISMPDLSAFFDPTDLQGDPTSGVADALVEGDVWPTDVSLIGEIIAGLRSGDSPHIPDSIYNVGADGAVTPPNLVTEDETFAGPYLPNMVYVIECTNSNSTLTLPSDTVISKVVIVADCKIKGSSGMTLTDIVMASSAVGNGSDPLNQNSIHFAADADIGSLNYCESGGAGGAMFVSAASMSLAAGVVAEGIRVIAAGNFDMTANNDVYGISAQAGNDISHTSNGEFGLCPNGTLPPGQYAFQYRLVL